MKQKIIFDDAAGLSRIGAMSDGVFSIVITLLVFDLKLPLGTPADMLVPALGKLAPSLLSYFITFFLIGIYWVGHHAVMRHVCRYDRKFLWRNILFLMSVAFLPFPTSLLGQFPGQQISIMLYGLTLIATGCTLSNLWSYATNGHLLVESTLSKKIIQAAHQRILAAPIIAVFSILISFISVRASIGLYVLAGILYLMPARLDRVIARETGVDTDGEGGGS